jgi:DNA-binding LacI/PurR family transcriptional regulator
MPIYPNEKYRELRQLVEEQAGQKLPGERELASQFGVPRSGIRALLDELEAEGLVRRQQGSGTYAVDKEAKHLKTVALLIDAELKLGDDPFFTLLVEYLQAHLQANGINCMIERTNQHWRPRNGYDGAITLGQAGQAVLAHMQKDTPPVVCLLLDAKLPIDAPASIFQLADREAGNTAVQRLLAAGCREVVFVGKRDIPASRERLAGVEERLNEANVPLHFVNCSLNYTAGLRLGQELELPESDEPIGMIAANDWLAIGLRAGLSNRVATRLPKMLLISFDGLPITADELLRIESLVAPLQTIAVDAVAELHRLLTHAPGRVVHYAFHWR